MQSFRVELGPRSYPVHVGRGILDRLGGLARAAGLRPGRAAVVSDSNVTPLYADRVIRSLRSAGFESALIEIKAGEASKSLDVVQTVYDRMFAAELDRSGVVFALGGGVVGDLAGFAAATFMRGIAIVQVPTTTVAQVDSALGGKTGVNHPRGKNLIGAFHQPRLVVADVDLLKSLPEREFKEGLAEVIKYGAIMDAAMIADLEKNMGSVLDRKLDALKEIVERSLRHKAAIVAADERESGRRRILNFGHTVAHALERASGYGSYLHGEAVAIGMVQAARLSSAVAGLDATHAQRLTRLIEQAGLPTRMPKGWRGEEFLAALRMDKKRERDGVEFVLIDRLGHALSRRFSFEQVLAHLG